MLGSNFTNQYFFETALLALDQLQPQVPVRKLERRLRLAEIAMVLEYLAAQKMENISPQQLIKTPKRQRDELQTD